jgi:hypothetical protein
MVAGQLAPLIGRPSARSSSAADCCSPGYSPLSRWSAQLRGDIRIIAFVTDTVPIERILTHIGEPPHPPATTPARGQPACDDDLEALPDWDLIAQPHPGFVFDQRISW